MFKLARRITNFLPRSLHARPLYLKMLKLSTSKVKSGTGEKETLSQNNRDPDSQYLEDEGTPRKNHSLERSLLKTCLFLIPNPTSTLIFKISSQT